MIHTESLSKIIEEAKEIIAKPEVCPEYLFRCHDIHCKGYLTLIEMGNLYARIRQGGISQQQVHAAIKYTCIDEDAVEKEDLLDALKEMDRRYFLLQDLKWEFSMLSGSKKDTIPEQQARWLMQMVHGHLFSNRKWNDFIKARAVPGSEVSFAEIEVDLCNIPSNEDVLNDLLKDQEDAEERKRKATEDAAEARKAAEKRKLEEQRIQRNKQEAVERKQRELLEEQQREEERLRKLKEAEEDAQKKAREESDALKEALEKEKQAEEEEARRLEQLAKEREAELQAEKERYANVEQLAAEAAEQERIAERELLEALEEKRRAKEEQERQKAEQKEIAARKKLREIRRTRIRQDLKVAIKSRDKYKLEPAIKEFEEEKLEDNDMDLEKAKKILREILATDGLRDAISKRQLEELERAMAFIRKNGFEPQLANEMIEANRLLAQLRRLERIRHEILELKQSTVAEIRSYQNPPAVVHNVMIAVFLLHGHKEKETKNWKAVQALVGKTGKESLKRRCLEYKPAKLELPVAKRAEKILNAYELDEVRDVSAGAATFYCWATGMVEEAISLDEAKKAKAKQAAEAKAAAYKAESEKAEASKSTSEANT